MTSSQPTIKASVGSKRLNWILNPLLMMVSFREPNFNVVWTAPLCILGWSIRLWRMLEIELTTLFYLPQGNLRHESNVSIAVDRFSVWGNYCAPVNILSKMQMLRNNSRASVYYYKFTCTLLLFHGSLAECLSHRKPKLWAQRSRFIKLCTTS